MSQLAGPAVDQLAKDFAGQPVIFLEQNVDASLGNRNYRWWSAYWASGGSNSTTLPEAMASSGNQIANGTVAFPNPTTQKYYSAYKNMVAAELARPPEATIEAFAERAGDKIQLTVWVTNHSEQTLHAWDNSATVNAIVYEDAHILLTDRVVRAAVDAPLMPELAPGETALFELSTPALSGVNWDKLHTVAFVDYQPDDGAYDMLQAAVPSAPDFIVWPQSLTFMVDQADPGNPTVQIQLRGTADMTWQAEETLPWLDVTPSGDSIANPPVVSVNPAELASGWQQGDLAIKGMDNDGTAYMRTLTVRAYFGDVLRGFLPAIVH